MSMSCLLRRLNRGRAASVTRPPFGRGALRSLPLSVALTVVFCALSAGAQQAESDLTRLSLEQLMDIKITSVAKKPQRVSQSAAAVHVITSEDIRRSGATSIPELLRNVPGLNVGKIDANKWAISARGFNGLFSNKLLVLMDGRSVYTPLFSGVFWDVQDTFLDDIERIEVVRGPGGSLWGANAVNGVINIITKNTEETTGTLVRGIHGTEEKVNIAGRFGQAIDDRSNLRLFAKNFRRDGGVLANGNDADDDWSMQRGGFRYDSKPASGGSFMLQGEVYFGQNGQLVALPTLTAPFAEVTSDDTKVEGQFLLGRWQNASDFTLQAYFDRAIRDDIHVGSGTRTFDVDLQKRYNSLRSHDIIVGGGYRFTTDFTIGTNQVWFDPKDDDYHLLSAFVNDEISLSDTLKLVLGTKVEFNSFTGFEIQPSVRSLWNVTPAHTLWAAVSRAVRTPSRAADAATINNSVRPGTPPVQARILGNDDVKSEELTAFELGFKSRPLPSLSVDVAAFYNVYDRLVTTEPGTAFLENTPAPAHLVQPLLFANNMSGEAYGLELSADWRARDWFRVRGSYTLFELELHRKAGTGTASNEAAEKRDPRHQLSLTAELDLGSDVELDATFRAVDRLSERNIRGYMTADVRLAWKPLDNVELSLVGRNLLQSQQAEARPEFLSTQITEVERSFYGSLKIEF